MNLKEVRKTFCNPLMWMDKAEADLYKWSQELLINSICVRCGNEMTHIQACHERCDNCGSELTCSDI